MKSIKSLGYLFVLFTFSVQAQTFLSLDSCRALAIQKNKTIKIAQEEVLKAGEERKVAFTKYLPHLTATATYFHNQKEASILNKEQKNKLTHLGTSFAGGFQETAKQLIQNHPHLAPLVQSLGDGIIKPVAEGINQVGEHFVNAFRTDTRNIYTGILTLTQPIYMGGKIRAYNRITAFAEQLAKEKQVLTLQDVILSTDQAYWQVVSLTQKKKLALGYIQLLRTVDANVEALIKEGIATKSDGLSVKVKLNEAEMALLQVEDGLALSRMLLCQICGLDLTTDLILADEKEIRHPLPNLKGNYDLTQIYQNRPEIKSLDLATAIYKEKAKATKAEHLPSLAFVGNYLLTNPSFYNGFENKFKGMWNVGLMLQIPIWNWGETYHKARSIKHEARIIQLQTEEAKEKIALQVSQAQKKIDEATKKLSLATKNTEKAEENLRYANLGFREGVITTANVLEAHAAWLSAQSILVDAKIDVQLTNLYLQKAIGNL